MEHSSNAFLPAIPGNGTGESNEQARSRTQPEWHGFELENLSAKLEMQKVPMSRIHTDMKIGIGEI